MKTSFLELTLIAGQTPMAFTQSSLRVLDNGTVVIDGMGSESVADELAESNLASELAFF